MFTAEAAYSTRNNLPMFFRASMHCTDRHQASIIASRFPKYVKVKIFNLVNCPGKTASVWFDVDFTPNEVTGSLNETGQKRVRKFLELCGEFEWNAQALNHYKTFEEFEAAAL